jgi:hypothetical protein
MEVSVKRWSTASIPILTKAYQKLMKTTRFGPSDLCSSVSHSGAWRAVIMVFTK